MVRKKIRGVVTTTELAQGETADVEFTDHVKGLLESGYIELAGRTQNRQGHRGEDHRRPGARAAHPGELTVSGRVELHRGNIIAVLSGPAGPVVARMADYGRRTVNAAKRTAPVDNGTYRASLQYLVFARGTSVILRVGSDLHYAEYIAKGTGIYGPKHRPIRPVHRKFLKFKPKGATRFVFARQVKGSPPNPHLIDALRSVIPWPVRIHT